MIQSKVFFERASAAVKSPYMLKEHCRSKLNLVEPVHDVLRSESGHKIGTYSYVPITEVLARYCSHEDIVDEIQANRHMERDRDYLSNFSDGTYFMEHPFFKVNPNALCLHFYEYEFEVTNPTGSKRTKPKLCAFYYTVGNLDNKHQSKLKHIHLALLVRQTFVKHCGLQTVLKPMLDDLKKLERDGITIIINGIEQPLHAAVATFSADNLSAHMLGGFTMSFNSHRVCRFCMATYTEMKEKFNEDDFVLRSPEAHRYHLKSCTENPEHKVTYGVTGASPLSELNYFDVTKALPHDIMHDLLEGVIPLVLKLVVCQAHKEKHITIQEINEELQHLAIGQNDKKNRPVQLSERLMQSSGISGSAPHVIPFMSE